MATLISFETGGLLGLKNNFSTSVPLGLRVTSSGSSVLLSQSLLLFFGNLHERIS